MLELDDQIIKASPLNLRVFAIPILIVWSMVMIFLFGCQQVFKGMSEMMVLQQKLAEEFNTHNIGIKITNGTHLAVTFQNSQIATLSKSGQESKARQVASFVRDHYEGYGNLTKISVVFIRHNQYGPVSVTKTEAAFSFETSELDAATPQA